MQIGSSLFSTLYYFFPVGCVTGAFCTLGDLLVQRGCLGKPKALTTVATKQIIRNSRQHCSYSKSMHVHRTSHQPWCEIRRADHKLKCSVVSVYGSA